MNKFRRNKQFCQGTKEEGSNWGNEQVLGCVCAVVFNLFVNVGTALFSEILEHCFYAACLDYACLYAYAYGFIEILCQYNKCQLNISI